MGSLFDREREYEAQRRAAAFSSLRAIILLAGVGAGVLLSVGLRRVSDELTPTMIAVYGLSGAAIGLLFGCGFSAIIRARRERRPFLAIGCAGVLLGVITVAFGIRTNRGVDKAQNEWRKAASALSSAEEVHAGAQRIRPGLIHRSPGQIRMETVDSVVIRIEATAESLERARDAELRAQRQLQLQKLLPEGPIPILLMAIAAGATLVGSAGYILVVVSSWRANHQTSDPPFWLARGAMESIHANSSNSSKGDDPGGTGKQREADNSSSTYDIVQCPACQMRVIPKADGSCPSCQHRGSWKA